MEFTRERLYPDLTPDEIRFVLYEHLARYQFASQYVKDKKVLDAACGSGYGSQILLSEGGAKEVIGIDISMNAIREAKKKFSHEGVQYRIGNVAKLTLENETFDVVVSFETIEHIPDGQVWLKEASRVLKAGGILVISTPNREVSSPGRPRNAPLHPYHCFEYTYDEFLADLAREFEIMEIYGQSLQQMWFLQLLKKVSQINAGRKFLSWLEKLKIWLVKRSKLVAKWLEKRWQRQARILPLQRWKKPYYVITVCQKKVF